MTEQAIPHQIMRMLIGLSGGFDHTGVQFDTWPNEAGFAPAVVGAARRSVEPCNRRQALKTP